jgi:hypothetical protein
MTFDSAVRVGISSVLIQAITEATVLADEGNIGTEL